MKRKFITVVLSASLVTACASNPNSISATYVDSGAYSRNSCSELSRTYNRVNSQLSRAIDVQKAAVSNDTLMMTMGMLFLWPALFFIKGDAASGQIADLKGKKNAVEDAMSENAC